jgi:hypothetical protein
MRAEPPAYGKQKRRTRAARAPGLVPVSQRLSGVAALLFIGSA